MARIQALLRRLKLDRLPQRAWPLALPALLLLGAFLFVPLANVFRYATWSWSGFATPESVGLDNLGRMMRDTELLRSLRSTLFFGLMFLPAFLLLSRFIAIAIEGTRLERPLKALLFMPSLITAAGAAIAWYLLYNPDYGFVFELTGVALPWTSYAWAGLLYVALFTLWQFTGYGVLVVSAALKGIPSDIKEAARVDGATEGEIRRYIVGPLLRPAMRFLVVIGTVFAIQSYNAVYLLTRGSPFGSTRVIGYYLYETAFRRFELGYAAALTLLMLLITLVVAVVQLQLFRTR